MKGLDTVPNSLKMVKEDGGRIVGFVVPFATQSRKRQKDPQGGFLWRRVGEERSSGGGGTALGFAERVGFGERRVKRREKMNGKLRECVK